MPILELQGIPAEYREPYENEEILFSEYPQEEQYFRRTPIPFSDDDLVAIANREHTYTAAEKEWVDRENKRMDEGVYAMINGVLTFIPGSHYGYVNYWTMENGKQPDYRNWTRKIFTVKEFLFNHSRVLGLTRGKSRRKGATSEGTFWEWWICGRKPEQIGGMVSYSDESVKKIFSMLFMRGFKGMLPCFVEEFDSNSDNFVRFRKNVEKKKKGVPIKREGLNSSIDSQPTTLNSYDSGRLSYFLGDEFGKWEKVNINSYWSKAKSCLTEGRKKVGFGYFPTTVNPPNKGGENFQKFWENANQHAINKKTGEPYGLNTPSRIVRIFDPAYEGYAGCIDKFGESVIEDPLVPIMGNDGEWITEGAKTVILKEREGLEGDQLMEHRRDYPLDEYDMFAFATGVCEFDMERLIARIKYLEDNPAEAFWRQVRFYERINEDGKLIVDYADDPKGEWWLKEAPMEPNNYYTVGETIRPQGSLFYSLGADTYKNIFAEHGSEGTICVFKKSLIVNGDETGLYPVAFFVGRPKLIKQFNRQAFLACLYYGAKINYEIDAGTWFYEDFLEWGGNELLVWEPARDPVKRSKIIKPGTESAQPFQLAKQLEVAKLYYDGNIPGGYNGNIHRNTFIPLLKDGLAYNHSERTPHHLTVSLQMALLPVLSSPPPPKKNQERKPVLPTYKLKFSA